MLVSFNWLKEFVDIDRSPTEIAELLTMGGIEVESVLETGRNLEKARVARVEKILPHPTAANLQLVDLNLGKDSLTVVCGATNVRVGMVAPYAAPGFVLPGDVVVETREVKGILSPGMLCSEKELGLGEDASGVLELDPTLPVGAALTDALPYLVDTILETSVTPNRGDCLSIVGVAREIAALLGASRRTPDIDIAESAENIAESMCIRVPDADLCPRYIARMLRGVRIGPSPLDVRVRLSRHGVRPISNVVDVTNLVLLECGQPLHAFDYSLLEDRTIIVERCAQGEVFTTLDGVERRLPANSLMIKDGKRSVALAGIMGGLNSEIGGATRDVLIESACFERFGVRRTSKALGLSTEASYRFERGVDPIGTLWAAHRSAQLMQRLAGGEILKGVLDVYPAPISRPTVKVRPRKVSALLGLEVSTDRIVNCLERLEVTVNRVADDELECAPPSWRWDLDREVDMAEEVARVIGYQNIPTTMPSQASAPDRTREGRDLIGMVGRLMCAAGYSEIITMSFVTESAAKEFDLFGKPPLALLNPLTEDHAMMRTSLLPGLLAVTTRNVNFRNADLKLFEIGRVFEPIPGAELPREHVKLGFIALGARHAETWNQSSNERVDFYDVKGALENVLDALGLTDISFTRSTVPFLHPGKSADVKIGGQLAGFVGELSPITVREKSLDCEVFVCEVFLEPLFAEMCKENLFVPIPRYPYIERDLSIIVEEKVSHDEIKRLISGFRRDMITSVNLFDFYRGESIPKGRFSLAFRLRYQSEDRTLTDEEVLEVHSQLMEALKRELGAAVRE